MLKNLLVTKRFKKDRKQQEFIERFEEKKRELNRCQDFNKQKEIMRQMSLIAGKIPHLGGWPYNAKVFWDDDATVWDFRIEDEYRDFIRSQISLSGRIIELGSGSTPSVRDAVCLDLSYEMLKAIQPIASEQSSPYKLKVQADVQKLPFKSEMFDNCVMVFLANYITDLESVFNEIKRILTSKGRILIIQSVVAVDSYHLILEKHPVDGFEQKLRHILERLGFRVAIQQKNYKNKSIWLTKAVKA